MAELQEMLAKYLPGSKIKIEVIRNKKSKTIEATLVNEQGGTEIIKEISTDILGAKFEELDNTSIIGHGVIVTDVEKGCFATAGIKKGTIILKINNTKINTIDDIRDVINRAKNSDEPVLFITALTNNGNKVYYSVPLQ